MKDAIKLIIVLAVVALIAFPILAYMGVNSPLPFADWGLSIYTVLNNKLTTTFSTVYGLVGATGVSTAAAIALGYLVKQKSKAINWAKGALSEKETAVKNLTEETTALGSTLKLKDEAFTKLETVNADLSTKYSTAQTQIATMEGQLKTQTDQAQALATKTQALINDAAKTKLPTNTIFTSSKDPNKTLMVIEKEYIT